LGDIAIVTCRELVAATPLTAMSSSANGAVAAVPTLDSSQSNVW
jgi:hypothetical protein